MVKYYIVVKNSGEKYLVQHLKDENPEISVWGISSTIAKITKIGVATVQTLKKFKETIHPWVKIGQNKILLIRLAALKKSNKIEALWFI